MIGFPSGIAQKQRDRAVRRFRETVKRSSRADTAGTLGGPIHPVASRVRDSFGIAAYLSPEVAAQAQAIATDSTTAAEATKDTPPVRMSCTGSRRSAATSDTEHVFHLCAAVRPPKDKTVNSGSVTEAQNAIRITKQIEMDQKQCGFTATP